MTFAARRYALKAKPAHRPAAEAWVSLISGVSNLVAGRCDGGIAVANVR